MSTFKITHIDHHTGDGYVLNARGISYCVWKGDNPAMYAFVQDVEKRLAEAEAKNKELEKELFILSSDIVYCGCGHVTSGLQEKAKRIYGKLRESGGEGWT